MLSPDELQYIRQQAEQIARQGGAILRAGFGRVRRLEFKDEAGYNLVTEFDRRSEEAIVAALQTAFPTHHICAEERGEAGASSAYTWHVDPLYGTSNYAHNFPNFAVSLALVGPEGPLVGVVYDPMRAECFTAARGQGARLNDAPLRVSQVASLAGALVASGFPYDRRTAWNNNALQWGWFLRRTQGVRRMGAAALDLAYVAAGRLDGYWEARVKSWDVLAGGLLVMEAGGLVSDYSGGDGWQDGAEILASNGRIHQEMLTVLQEGEAAPRPAPSMAGADAGPL